MELEKYINELILDNVRYFELVKITIHTSIRKSYIIIGDKNIYFTTCDLSIIKNGKINYSTINDIIINCGIITIKLYQNLLIPQNNIINTLNGSNNITNGSSVKDITNGIHIPGKGDTSTLGKGANSMGMKCTTNDPTGPSTVTPGKGANSMGMECTTTNNMKNESNIGIYEIIIESPDYMKLYNNLIISRNTFNILKNYQILENNIKIDYKNNFLPFYKYKKIIIDDYYIFLKNTYKVTTLNGKNYKKYEDDRGIDMTIIIYDSKFINNSTYNIYNTTRKFLPQHNTNTNTNIKDTNTGIEDTNTNTGIEDTNTNTGIEDTNIKVAPFGDKVAPLGAVGTTVGRIIYDDYYFKKMNLNCDISKWLYIPPLLDKYQDIEITFKLKNNLNIFNEFNVIVNSLTSSNNTFFIDKNLIKIKIDKLNMNFNYYKEIFLNYKLHISYFNLIKSFIGSLLKLLPINTDLIYKLNVDISDEPMEYISQILSLQKNLDIMEENKFLMKLADFITYTIDNFIISEMNLLNMIVRNSNERVIKILYFLMHFRSIDFNLKYTNNSIENILKYYNNNQLDINWDNLTFNYYTTSRLIEEGLFNIKLINTEYFYSITVLAPAAPIS
uniref:Uncharacterized protein n=1 Tax=Theileria annulata TaxID=5874 RepID=A0A3B0MSI1_THEAN